MKKIRMPPKEEQDRQYKEWLEEQTFHNVDDDKIKYVLLEELKFLSQMSVEEYTLWRKWREIQEKYPIDKSTNLFFKEDLNYYPELNDLKNNIWIPESSDDYRKLEPTIVFANNPKLVKTWNALRILIHSQHNNTNIGRNLFFIVIDGITNKYLGIICLSSDFLDLTPRDNYIGWTREQRTEKKRINYTSIGSTIVPTQPLGYNYLGGKLMALLTISNITEQAWNGRYKNRLAGITTTSLYGSFSQYQNLQYWTKRGHSTGSIKFEPSRDILQLVKEWLRFRHTRRYWEWYSATGYDGMPLKRDYKQRSLSFAYRQFGIPKEYTETNHQRGIYFCPLYNNTREFLREEIKEGDLIRRFDNSVEALVSIWKERYAKKRVERMVKDGKYNTDILFYHGMIGKSWEEAKELYLKEVGR